MYVNTTAEVKALTDYCCTSANAVDVVRHIYETHGADTEILFGPDMWLGAYVEKELGRRMHVWDGECHVHAGIRPADIEATRASHPGADFLIHPECGCSTSVMEYVAAGDVVGGGRPHALDRRDAEVRRARPSRAAPARRSWRPRSGCCTRSQMAAPDVEFIPANAEASCQFMKMITLPKLRDALRDDDQFEVRVARGDRRAGQGADRSHGRDRLSNCACPDGARRVVGLELLDGVRPDAGHGQLVGHVGGDLADLVEGDRVERRDRARRDRRSRRRRRSGWRRGERPRWCSRRPARGARRRRREPGGPPPRSVHRRAAHRRSRACGCRPRRTCPTRGPSRAAAWGSRRRCGRRHRPSSTARASRGSHRTVAIPSSRRAASE